MRFIFLSRPWRAAGLAATFAAISLLGACDDDGSTAVDAAGADAGADAGSPDSSAGSDGAPENGATTFAHTLFATEGETLVAFDLTTGAARPGVIANVQSATDLQALASGLLLVNLTARNEILVVDGRTFSEVTRIKSSDLGATRPVHAFITPPFAGKQYWVANNDGASGMAATNSLRFIDVTAGSANFLQPVGEILLGIGHHKNAFSRGKARVSVSNIADCANVLQVIDYTDASKPVLVKKWSAAEINPAIECASKGAAPHGAAAGENGHGYHNFTGWGVIVAVDQEKDDPTFKLLPTKGTGAGYTKAGRTGTVVYSLQRTPREGDTAAPGLDCQIGNLVAIDVATNAVASETPILYAGGGCQTKLPATATLAGPDHMKVSKDGRTLFVATQAAPPMGSTAPQFSDQLVVFDLSDPAKPVQKASIKIGAHSGHRGMSLSGDGKSLFVVNANDKSVSQVDVATLTVTRTIGLKAAPAQLATWGSAEGPSDQTGPH